MWDMWRMRQILKYLCNYPYRKGSTDQERYNFVYNGVNEGDFSSYILYKKDFLEAYQSTIKNFIFQHLGIRRGTTKIEMKRAHKRLHRTKLLIDACRKKEYIAPSLNGGLKLTSKGQQFGNSWVVFFNECFKEYPILGVFIGSIFFVNLFRIIWSLAKPILLARFPGI